MANKALGRDLGALLSQARPSRLVARITGAVHPSPDPTPTLPISAAGAQQEGEPAAPSPVPLDLPLPLPPPADSAAQPLSATFASLPSAGGSAARTEAGSQPLPSSVPAASGTAAYQPATPPPTPIAFYVLVFLDVLCLAAAAVFAFSSLLPSPLGSAMAILATLAGAAFGSLGYCLRPVRPAKTAPSKVRVQLRRL